MFKQNIFLILVVLLLPIFTTQAQINKKENSHIWNLGGGLAAGDLGLGIVSYYGPDININYRKTVIPMGKYMNISVNLDAFINITFIGFILKTKIALMPVLAPSINFNLLEGAYPGKKSRSFFGFFLGAGMMTIPTIFSDALPAIRPDFGPIVNTGFRIRPGKGNYITVKIFGGVVLKYERSFGGLNLTFPLGGNRSKFGSHACKKHSRKVYR